MYRASKTLCQTSLTFCQTVMGDDLPCPAKEDLESAYIIAGAVLEGDDLRLALLARDLHNGGEMVGGGRHHATLPVP